MNDLDQWQLKLFRKTLKKKLRLRLLQQVLNGLNPGTHLLLITCGDNNGAVNYYLRELGGKWCWAELEHDNIQTMHELLGDPIAGGREDLLPFGDEKFDYVISIDVHEHIDNPEMFTREMSRLLKKDGTMIITTPGGDSSKWINRLKKHLGMTRQIYGHKHDGFNVSELKRFIVINNLKPQRSYTFSRFFTELLELSINFMYVKILSRKKHVLKKEGVIAPQTKEQLQSIKKIYIIYSLLYPFFWFFSKLDIFLFFTEGYVSLVTGTKSGKVEHHV